MDSHYSDADDETEVEDERAKREVVLSRGYWLGETPVVQALWQAVMDSNPSHFKDSSRPVESVSWRDAQAFIERLNNLIEQEDGECFRLPTEAEWEHACRAATTTATYAGEPKIEGLHDAPILDTIAWYGGNSGVDYDLGEGHDSSGWPEKQYRHSLAGTRQVKLKRPNAWGLYDTLGNVWEFCMDTTYRKNRSVIVGTSPPAGSPDDHRVSRGGSWFDGAGLVHAASRDADPPDFRSNVLGFRLARGSRYFSSEDLPSGEPSI